MIPMPISFTVYGKPLTEGSVSNFPYKKKDGRMGVRTVHQKGSELYAWRNAIAEGFLLNGGKMTEQAVFVDVEFVFIRPKSVSERKRPYMIVKPDVDKLIRAVLDALTGVAYKDDSQVIRVNAVKRYATEDECREMAKVVVYYDEIQD